MDEVVARAEVHERIVYCHYGAHLRNAASENKAIGDRIL